MIKTTMKTPIKVVNKTPKSTGLHFQGISTENSKERDPVQVFCRVRPLQSNADLTCTKVKDSKTIILTPPEIAINYKHNAQKQTQYVFKHVFEPTANQREIFSSVAKPLVENLIKGKNSLLFTYGVTGSGKTYTMTGDTRDRGIMPRCLDTLFRTISDYQAKKYIFKPDKLNGFEILSDADALLERQAEMNSRFAKGHRKDSDPEIASQASANVTPLLGLDEDNMYAVFITYIEVYNNSVYDLLEDGGIQRTLQSKIIREDGQHNMYVHGVTEIEIKSVEEAINAFQTGQKKKRMGHTILNAESSRSHSVFTIRLVQAPTDCNGENIIKDKQNIIVSQLSLVDLAGSERTSRTKNTGQRLREAGNINNSLMTLRTCLEYLRENQLTNSNKKIPYRDSKVTHLFKNYFDGEGQVSMIVCINPRAEDYDENSQVMKFAEMTQEVQIARPVPIKNDIGLTPGRCKANKLFKTAVNNLYELGHIEARKLDIDLALVYSLGPNFPKFELDSPEADDVIKELMQYLEQRIEKRKTLRYDLENRCDHFRVHLLKLEKDNLALKTENASLKATFKQERLKASAMEKRLIIYESSIDEINRKLSDKENQVKELQKQLSQKKYLLSQKEYEKEKQKKKFDAKMAVEQGKMDRELQTRLREQSKKINERMRFKDEKLKLVSDILRSKQVPSSYMPRSASFENLAENKVPSATSESQQIVMNGHDNLHTSRQPKGIAVANSRHRRSRSAGDKWLEHRAANPVPLGTILQPYLKNRKSITKLTEVKDLTNKTTKYCLISQDADTDGDVETKLYKGNVIPTCAGGAQVIFNDVECLKQKSPVPSPNRKRPSNLTTTGTTIPVQEITSRCTMSIEGHNTKRSKF